MTTVPSLEFLTDGYTLLYFAVILSQLISLYTNAKNGKKKLAIASLVFIMVFSYMYLSKYYTLK